MQDYHGSLMRCGLAIACAVVDFSVNYEVYPSELMVL